MNPVRTAGPCHVSPCAGTNIDKVAAIISYVT